MDMQRICRYFVVWWDEVSYPAHIMLSKPEIELKNLRISSYITVNDLILCFRYIRCWWTKPNYTVWAKFEFLNVKVGGTYDLLERLIITPHKQPNMSNPVITNKDSCLLWFEISNSLMEPCRLFKGSSCLDNEEGNFIWNSVYIYQTTRRQMSEGINLRSHRRDKILCHITHLNFIFIYSFSTFLFLSFLSSFLSTVFLLYSPANQWKLISSLQFTFLILHEDLNRSNLMRFNTLHM
jgi:hypothetical protein